MLAADPGAAAMIVADVGPLEGGRFRWTGQTPTVHLTLPQTSALRLRARFWIAGEALKATGPIGIVYRINGTVLDRARYVAPGEQFFDKPVDAALLHAGTNEVRMEIDKVYQRPDAKLGVALAELGFTD